MPPQSTSSWMQPHSVAFMSYEQASCWFKILLQAREWVSRVGEEPSMLKTRICLLESLVHEGLVLDCWQAHCIPLFHMQPWCATLCFMDLHDLASLLLSRCMQSQHPSVLPFHDNGLCPSSFLSSSLCSPLHSWGSVHFMPQLVFFFFNIYFSLFSLYHAKSCCYLLFRPMSTSPYLLIPGFPLPYHLWDFMWFLPARPLCFYLPAFLLDKGPFRLHATQGQDRQEDRGGHCWGEHTAVAGFATCIMWALCILRCSSSCPNWFFALIPRMCLLESLNSGR